MVTRLSAYFIFAFSLILYTVTLEPTTSFWDCSEFILSAAKLEVNHPAGAPLFMLLGRVFTFLSFGDPGKVAWAINFMSGFFSALTIYFLFHVIVKLALKKTSTKWMATGSGVVGALSFAVSDSFWFSAVEGEVYALSMFFLILSFWAAIKWEESFGKTGSDKWILFLGLIIGLGIGVHLLNLLVLPSVVMLMGFKKYDYTVKKMLLFFAMGLAVLLGVLYVLTPILMKTLAWFDYVFVNKFKLPLHSGALFGCVFVLALFTGALVYFRNKGKRLAELIVLSVLFVVLGFSVYSVNIIRSSSNPPVNFGRPNNIYSLINYLNREQYPKRPLLKGQNYNSPVTKVNERFSKDFLDGEYRETKLAPNYDFDKKTTTLFPRMYSREQRHIDAYKSWINIKGKRVSLKKGQGRETVVVPALGDQLAYFMKYQFGYMFGRYFMWNFVGRQNDRQGRGEILNGNWLSGVSLIDNARLGDQDSLPNWLKSNKARNTYFFLPLILGLIGAWYQYKKQRDSFFIVLALFIMGGLGLTVYINEIPITPRERDYVFVGAFMAFCIWIGMSLPALVSLLRRRMNKEKVWVPVFVLVLLMGPGIMLDQNFDDHDRSGRYAALDFAHNILRSCPPNSILFTSGDNDTYPLLYCQEVEGIRTDVRVVIMPFLSANWFVDGLRLPKYNDPGLKMFIPQKRYDYGELDYVPVLSKLKRDTSWQEAFQFLNNTSENAKVTMNTGNRVNFIPLTHLHFHIEAEGKKGNIPVSLENEKILYKNQLVFWDIISSNATKRPICFVSKYEAQKHGLLAYLKCEGFVYRLVPEAAKGNTFSLGQFNTEELYEKLMNDYKWGNISDDDVYVDWNTITNFTVFQVRNVYNEVAVQMLREGKKEKAIELLKYLNKQFPLSQIPYDIFSLRQLEIMLNAGMNDEGLAFFWALEKEIQDTLRYYQSLNSGQQIRLNESIQRELTFLNHLIQISSKLNDEAIKTKLEAQFADYYKALVKRSS